LGNDIPNALEFIDPGNYFICFFSQHNLFAFVCDCPASFDAKVSFLVSGRYNGCQDLQTVEFGGVLNPER
jgi:hypothetical protein